MALPACDRCGQTDPRRMFGLMTLWFGPFVDMPPDYGYFHLCPTCYGEYVKPHLDQVQGRLAELHPLSQQLAQNEDHPGAQPAGDGVDADQDIDDHVAAGGGSAAP